MEGNVSPGCFLRQWIEYLREHGHAVCEQVGPEGVIRSRTDRGRGFRWVLRCSWEDSILLTVPDRKALIREARLARRSKEDCYLVAAFGRPVEKVVVLPVSKAVRMKRITAHLGGIPWER